MFISLMLLNQVDGPFDDARWIYEPKIDGHRLLLSKMGGVTKLYTRYQNECTGQYPELHSVPLDGDVILYGEVFCVNQHGQIDFELVMNRFILKGPTRLQRR